jgi:hypothetical protein
MKTTMRNSQTSSLIRKVMVRKNDDREQVTAFRRLSAPFDLPYPAASHQPSVP